MDTQQPDGASKETDNTPPNSPATIVLAPDTPKKNPTIVRVAILICVVAGVILGICLLLLHFARLNGYFIPPPNPQSPKLVAARNASQSSIKETFRTLDGGIGFTNYATTTQDLCYGTGNTESWNQEKIANICIYHVAEFYGFNGDFRQQMIDLDTKIRTMGWQLRDTSGTNSYELPMKEIMEKYYDTNYDKNHDFGGSYTPANTQRPERKYLISDLPTPGEYANGKDVLRIRYTERDSPDLSDLEDAQYVNNNSSYGLASWHDGYALYDKKSFQDASTILKNATADNKFVLVVTIERSYFSN